MTIFLWRLSCYGKFWVHDSGRNIMKLEESKKSSGSHGPNTICSQSPPPPPPRICSHDCGASQESDWVQSWLTEEWHEMSHTYEPNHMLQRRAKRKSCYSFCTDRICFPDFRSQVINQAFLNCKPNALTKTCQGNVMECSYNVKINTTELLGWYFPRL